MSLQCDIINDAIKRRLREVARLQAHAVFKWYFEQKKDVKMPMKGRYPIRRTIEYLLKGDIIFKNRVKIMTVNYNTHGELSDGARSEIMASQNTFQLKHCI